MSQFISRIIGMLKNDHAPTQGEIRRSVAGVERVIDGYKHEPNWDPLKRMFGELICCGGNASAGQVQELLENPNLELDGSLFINIGNISDCFMVPAALYDSTLLQITCKKVVDLNVLLTWLLPVREVAGHVLRADPMRKIAILLTVQLAKIAKTHDCEAAAIRYHSIADSLIQKVLPESGNEPDYDESHNPYPYSIMRCWTYCRDKHALNAWMVPVELVDKDHFERLGYAEVVHRVMESVITHFNIGNVSEHNIFVDRSVHYLRSIFSADSLASEAFSEACAPELSNAVLHIPDNAGTLTLVECFLRINRDANVFGSRIPSASRLLLSDILCSKETSDDTLIQDMVKAHACVLMCVMELANLNAEVRHAITAMIGMHFEAFGKFAEANSLVSPDLMPIVPGGADSLMSVTQDADAIQWILKYAKEFSTSVHSVTFADGTTRTFQQREFEKQLDFVQAELAWGKKHIT